MVLPTAPPASLSVSQILTEFGIAAGTQKRLSNDLFPLVGGTAGATCSLGASFSGKSSVSLPYAFTTATFTSGGATGRAGPVISQARSGLTGTPAPSTWYNTYLNMTTQGIQQWTVPSTGTYTIEATGAAGGLNPGQTEARGARIIGTVSLTQGEILNIVVGQPGTGGTRVNSPGGGGGTFVYRNASTPLIIAGAGAGMRANWSTDAQGQAGQNAGYARGNDNILNGSITAYAGQENGGAGEGSWQGPNNGYTRYACSGGGAGWRSQGHETGSGAPSFTKFPPSGCGQNGCYGRHVSAAEPFLGGTGSCGEGNNGGFGGGGGGGCEGEGGGGGYTGGAGTWSTNSHGGGGGSYNGGSSQTNTAGYQSGGGYVTITAVAAVSGPRSVNLNFYPPSVDSRGDMWQNQGALIMARSIVWAWGGATSGNLRVYYVHASSQSWANEVEAKIRAYISANFPSLSLTFFNDTSGAPNISTLTRSNYDVVFVSSDSTPGSWGTYLNAFAVANGNIVLSTFANSSQSISGFLYNSYTPITGIPGNQSLGGSAYITVVDSGHFITQGLTTFFAGNSGYGGLGTALSSGAVSIVNYTGSAAGTTCIAVKQFGGVTSLYTFTTATFTPGGATGQNGPIISQARSGLTGTPTPSTWYNTYLNMSTQGIQLWTVPATGTYTIVVAGAKGGDSNGVSGGYGRIVQATFSLTQGEVIQIVVGQMGTSTGNGQGTYGAGGGGGSYVVQLNNTPLLVAGGGGGSQNNSSGFSCSAPGQNAPFTNQGTNPTGGSNSVTNGGGGNAFQGNWSGGGGGGLTGNGSLSPYGSSIGGDGWAQSLIAGISFTNGALGGRGWRSGTSYTNVGGSPGGFGGGGGAANDSAFYPGGGGGYVGGDGTAYCGNVPGGAGGGGGYYSSGTFTANNGTNNGVGYVTITKI